MKLAVLFLLLKILSVNTEGQAPGAPDPAAMVQAPPVEDKCREISWPAVEGATSYTFWLNTNSWNTTDNVTTVCDLQLENGENTRRIQAHFADGNIKQMPEETYKKISEEVGCDLFNPPDGCSEAFTMGNRIPWGQVTEIACGGGYKIRLKCSKKYRKLILDQKAPAKYEIPSSKSLCFLAKSDNARIKKHYRYSYKKHPLAKRNDILIARKRGKMTVSCPFKTTMRIDAIVGVATKPDNYVPQYEMGRTVADKSIVLECDCDRHCSFRAKKKERCRRGRCRKISNLFSDALNKTFRYAGIRNRKKFKVNRIFALKCSP